MTIDQLSEKRKDLRQQLIANDAMNGFKELLTVLYSDKVHFIYELLQNAEDTRATEVQFVLKPDRLEFEHNGDRLFKIKNVESITNIGSSTKVDDNRSIGKFGIGFKAVFAYTSTPEIESGNFHFRIHDMFVPDTDGLAPGALGEKRTRFVFPFDNPDKSPEKASEEIEKKLRQLNENALLFLSNIRKIEYRLPDSTTGFLERRENANDSNRIEISIMRPEGIVPEPTHYLRFEKVVSVKDEDNDKFKKCRIATAFGMDKPRGSEWKIIPLNPGQVCIYFPATNAISKLRFHLHAPFASTVARDSVRDCPANDKLRDHLAELIAESMHTIRDRGLLNVEFLATLPNSRDNLLPFYLPIQKRLIKEFNTEKLTPMKRGSDEHAAASGCYRGQRILSDLIIDEDMATLLDKDPGLPMWIANPPRLDSSPEDNFLTTLDISQWTTEDFIQILDTSSESVIEWLKEKPDEWHQDLYVLLGDFLSRTPAYPYSATRERTEKLSNLCIIRCNDGEYRVGSDCHFTGNDVETDEDLHSGIASLAEGSSLESQAKEISEENFNYVDSAVYSSGNSKDQQEKAHKFLESIGVRKVNDAERVKAILEQRYKKGSIKPRKTDMEKFMSFVEDQPEKGSLFKNYFIFPVDLERDDSKWFRKPSGVFVDSPYLDTGLTAYYDGLTEDSDFFKRALSPDYAKSGVDLKRFSRFAEAVGAQTKLAVKKQGIPSDHPEHLYLVDMAEGQWRYNTGKNEDYIIPEIKTFLNTPSIGKSRLIWQTMSFLPEHCLRARFWNNKKFGDRPPGKSSLVHELRNAKWVPQENSNSISFVAPCDALIDDLPEGFPYEKGRKWLNAIELGKTIREQSAEYIQRDQQAKDFGFDSSEEIKKYAKLHQLLKDGKVTVEDVISKYSPRSSNAKPDFPTSTVRNPELRKKRVLKQVSNAPEKVHVKRERPERDSKTEIDQRTSLIEWYTNDSSEMICQICKEEMPFKKTDGEYYFMAVEALTTRFKDDELPKNHFPKEYEAQYLALCPGCEARYDYFARTAAGSIKLMEELRDQLMNSDDLEVPVCLGELETSIRFVEAHLHDLKEVLNYYENPQDSEESTD